MGVKIEKDNSISISGFEGIGQSPLSDFTDMLGINNSSNPGVASVGYKFNKVIEKRNNITWTYFSDSPLGGTIETASSVKYRGAGDFQAVILKTTGTLPTGLTTNTIYWVKGMFGDDADKYLFLADTLKKATTGDYVAFTASGGSGTHTLEILSPHIVRGWTIDKTGNIYLLDNNHRVWFTEGIHSSNTGSQKQWYCLGKAPSAGSGNGIIYYKGYILVFGNSKIDALAELSLFDSTVTWIADFAGVNINNTMLPDSGRMGAVPYISVNDDAVYFNNGNPSGKGDWRIGLLEEKIGETFNPGSGTTFTCVPDATYIPNLNGLGETTSIKELGENLIIGTRSNEIFFWDKKSPSFTYKISLPEEGTKYIEVKNETAYILTGVNGNCYATSGSAIQKLFEIPETITGEYYQYNDREGGNIDVKYTASSLDKDELLFAVEINGYCYLMSYNTLNGALVKKNISSLGERLMSSNASGSGYISQIISNRKNTIISSWYRTSTTATYQYALESLLFKPLFNSGTQKYYAYNNYEAYIQTGLISLGTALDKKTLRKLYVSFLRPIQTADSVETQGIKIYYKRYIDDTWTLLKTIDYATNGAIKDIQIEAPITDIIDIQFKIEINGYEMLTPYLKLIRLIP